MATVKQYETLVKKINDTAPEARAELAAQKAALVSQLRKQAGGDHNKRRKLKFEMDEANNS